MMRGLIALVAVLSACSGNPHKITAPGPRSGGLEVLELTPAAGALVDANTIINAKLAYSIPPGYPGEYRVIVQFANATNSMSTDGTFPASNYSVLEGERGTVEIKFPLRHVIGRADVATPLKMRFLLNITTAPRRAQSIADVGPFFYNVR